KVNKHILPKKPELNDDMYNWVIAKYGKPNTWTDSQEYSGHITFLINLDVPECSKKVNVQECSNIKEKHDQQDVHPDTDVIEIVSSSSELECSSTSELDYDESNSSDESGCLEKNEPGSMKMIVSQKGPSKDLLNWYEDVNDQDEEEIDDDDDETDEQDDEIDKEAEDGKDDSDDELWSPKTIGTTTKKFISPKMKRASSNSTPSTKKLVKSSEPIRNCIIGLANNKT
ncbi:hypothetical protein Tco_1358639, partial [Tanacetum coccineum]